MDGEEGFLERLSLQRRATICRYNGGGGENKPHRAIRSSYRDDLLFAEKVKAEERKEKKME